MRLPAAQILQGLLHPDADVRYACLGYFAVGERCATVMPVVIDALQRWGRTKAFREPHLIVGLPQTPETVRWAVGELQRAGRTKAEQEYLSTISWLLRKADPRLIEPHVTQILKSPGFAQSHAVLLKFRQDLVAWDGPALWAELERVCDDKERRMKLYAGEMHYDWAAAVVEALARQGDQHVDRMMSLLSAEVETSEDNPMTWMQPFVVRLAGELRHEPAIPLILGKFYDDFDTLNEECEYALGRIGTDSVVEAIRSAYPSAEWTVRHGASSALYRIHSDLSVQASIELLDREEEDDLRDSWARSLVDQFSFEGNEVVRQFLVESFDSSDLRRSLVAACTLMGQILPELEGWRREIAEEDRKRPFDPTSSSPRSGRKKGTYGSNGSHPE